MDNFLPGWFVHFLLILAMLINRWKNRGWKKCSMVSVWQMGGGSKAIWAMPIWKQHISKRGFTYFDMFFCYLGIGKSTGICITSIPCEIWFPKLINDLLFLFISPLHNFSSFSSLCIDHLHHWPSQHPINNQHSVAINHPKFNFKFKLIQSSI